MLPAVDVACTAGDQLFPVHSYVLMAASPVFGELVAEHFSSLLKGSCRTEVLVVPLTDTTPQSAMAAFLFMYQQCSFQKMPDLHKREAKDIQAMATFAHKWNVQQMLDASDACISECMADTVHDLDTVIMCTQFAEKIHLEKTLEFCIMWIVLRLKTLEDKFPALLSLSQEVLVRVLQGVAANLPAGSMRFRRCTCRTLVPRKAQHSLSTSSQECEQCARFRNKAHWPQQVVTYDTVCTVQQTALSIYLLLHIINLRCNCLTCSGLHNQFSKDKKRQMKWIL